MTPALRWFPAALSAFDARTHASAHVERNHERPDAAKPWRWQVFPPGATPLHGWSPTMDAAKSAARRALAALPEYKP